WITWTDLFLDQCGSHLDGGQRDERQLHFGRCISGRKPTGGGGLHGTVLFLAGRGSGLGRSRDNVSLPCLRRFVGRWSQVGGRDVRSVPSTQYWRRLCRL